MIVRKPEYRSKSIIQIAPAVLQRDLAPNKERRRSDFSGDDSKVSIENRDTSLSARHTLATLSHSVHDVGCFILRLSIFSLLSVDIFSLFAHSLLFCF
jgi:hypothetical protein